MLHFYWTSKRTVVSKVVIFCSVWVAAGCGLSHSGPAVNAKRRDGPCRWTQTREEDMQPWGPLCPAVANSSSTTADCHDQNTRSSHANTVVTLLHMYRPCFLHQPRQDYNICSKAGGSSPWKKHFWMEHRTVFLI